MLIVLYANVVPFNAPPPPSDSSTNTFIDEIQQGFPHPLAHGRRVEGHSTKR